jgi:hypothetical protein
MFFIVSLLRPQDSNLSNDVSTKKQVLAQPLLLKFSRTKENQTNSIQFQFISDPSAFFTITVNGFYTAMVWMN